MNANLNTANLNAASLSAEIASATPTSERRMALYAPDTAMSLTWPENIVFFDERPAYVPDALVLGAYQVTPPNALLLGNALCRLATHRVAEERDAALLNAWGVSPRPGWLRAIGLIPRLDKLSTKYILVEKFVDGEVFYEFYRFTQHVYKDMLGNELSASKLVDSIDGLVRVIAAENRRILKTFAKQYAESPETVAEAQATLRLWAKDVGGMTPEEIISLLKADDRELVNQNDAGRIDAASIKKAGLISVARFTWAITHGGVYIPAVQHEGQLPARKWFWDQAVHEARFQYLTRYCGLDYQAAADFLKGAAVMLPPQIKADPADPNGISTCWLEEIKKGYRLFEQLEVYELPDKSVVKIDENNFGVRIGDEVVFVSRNTVLPQELWYCWQHFAAGFALGATITVYCREDTLAWLWNTTFLCRPNIESAQETYRMVGVEI